MIRYALAFLLAATTAHAAATWHMLSGFDVTDGGTPLDSYDFAAEVLGGAADADISVCPQSTTCQTHNSVNGGAPNSFKALKVTSTTAKGPYLPLDSTKLTINSTRMAVGFNIHVDSFPASTTYLAQLREGGTTGSSTTNSCYAVMKTDGTIQVKDGDGHDFGTTAKIAQPNYCRGGTCTSDIQCTKNGLGDVCVSGVCQNIRNPCATGVTTGCPSIPAGMGGGTQSCAAFTTSSGAGAYWAHLGLIGTTTGGGRLCELKWDGQLVLTGAAQSATPSNFTDLYLGASTAPTGAATIYYDDIVVETETEDIAMSYVDTLYPTTNGTPQQWTDDTCGGGSTHVDCIRDYDAGSGLGNGFLRSAGHGRQEVFDGLTTLTNNATAAALDAVWVGDQSNTNTSVWTPYLRYYIDTIPVWTDVPGFTQITQTGSTTTRTLRRQIINQTGISGHQPLTVENLNLFGMRFQNAPTNDTTNRVRAFAAYVQFTRADAPLSITLPDINGDTKVCIAGIGDSTAGGTLSLECQGGSGAGELCSQDTYCDVGGNSGITKDVPLGGCTLDRECQTCAGGVNNRKAEFNGGAGLPCGQNNGSSAAEWSCDQCGSATDDAITAGCCSGGTGCGNNDGTCSGSGGLTCGCDNDCLLGVCGNCVDGDCTAGAPTNICHDACPGGQCPTARSSWINYVPLYVGADLILQCPGPSESLQSMVTDRFEDIATEGQTSIFSLGSCTALIGTGACSCTVPTQVTDCGGGGICTNGICTAGDSTKTACTSSSQCGSLFSSHTCRFRDSAGGGTCPNGIDYPIVHEGYNDFLQALGGSDDCTGPHGLMLMDQNGGVSNGCDHCSLAKCVTDAEAVTARGGNTSAECGGHAKPATGNATTFPCYTDRATNSFSITADQCLLQSNACGCTAGGPCTDCDTGQTCDGWSGGATKDGWCDCGSDDPDPATNCPSGFSCYSHRCRKACTTNANCNGAASTGGVCRTAGGVNVCEGIATCPSNNTCTTDADCWNFGHCVTGTCQCAGHPIDINTSAPCRDSALALWDSSQGLYVDSGTEKRNPPFGMNRFLYNVGRMEAMAPTSNLIMTSLTSIPIDDHDQGPGNRFNWTMKRFRELLAGHMTFPHYIDTYKCFHNCADPNGHTDVVHHSVSGSLCLGLCVSQFLNALNVCATGSGTPDALAHPYCKKSDGTFRTTGGTDTHGSCTTAGDCSGGDTCAAKPCTTTSDCPGMAAGSCNLTTGAT